MGDQRRVRLSAVQAEVLSDVASGDVYFSRKIGTLYKSCDLNREGRLRNVTRVMHKLSEMEPPLVRLDPNERYMLRQPWKLTAAGREWLAEHGESGNE